MGKGLGERITDKYKGFQGAHANCFMPLFLDTQALVFYSNS